MFLHMRNERIIVSALVLAGLSVVFFADTSLVQSAPMPTQAATAALNLTATSANVKDAGIALRMSILRWSTDAERDQLVAAMTPPAAPATPPPAAEPPRGGGGGGRGAAAPPVPTDPILRLTDAIAKGPSLGYFWTNESIGYAIRYAYRIANPDKSERIILALDRRLGALTQGSWNLVPPPAAPPNYEFTIIEMRLAPNGTGDGKASLNTKVTIDAAAKTIALENYDATPAVLRNVKR